MRAIASKHKAALAGGASESDANRERDEALAVLTTRYEDLLMNPKEALSLGSVSRIVMPGESRRVLARNLDFLMRKYEPAPMGGPQREHE
jgi:acetyl-CoA carboxylase carboxyltransferase component